MNNLLYELSLIIAIGVGAQWLAWRLSWPPIVLWMVGGWFFGQQLNWINPAVSLGDAFHPMIELASAIILFEGGLSLKYKEFQKAGRGIRRLISTGLLLHLALLTSAGHYIAEWSWQFSLLVASILVVTGPTVITPVLKLIKLKSGPATFLKWEGIINDPLGALLAVLVYRYIVYTGDAAGAEAIASMAKAMLISLGISYGLSFSIQVGFPRTSLPDFLKVPFVFSGVLLSFTMANYLQEGAGLLAVTLFGIFLGNRDLPVLDDIKKFKENISTFLIAVLFVSLSATLEFDAILSLTNKEWLFIGATLFLVRPIAILASTVGSNISLREKVTISWFAPRGIVAASIAGVIGHKLTESGLSDGAKFTTIIFTIIFLSVFIFGFTIKWLAKLLGLVGKSTGGVIIVADSRWAVDFAAALNKMGAHPILTSQDEAVIDYAKEKEVPHFKGDITEEIHNDIIELSNFTQLLCLTSNDAYNAIICQQFSEHFSSNNVYQLPLSEGKQNSPKALSESMRGRYLNKAFQYDKLAKAYLDDWEFKIYDKNIDDFELKMSQNPIAILNKRNELHINVSDKPLDLLPNEVKKYIFLEEK